MTKSYFPDDIKLQGNFRTSDGYYSTRSDNGYSYWQLTDAGMKAGAMAVYNRAGYDYVFATPGGETRAALILNQLLNDGESDDPGHQCAIDMGR